MSLDLHRRAEILMAEGDRLHASGAEDRAAAAYREAADLELEAFRKIPQDRIKTRGIIATSAVALYRQAGLLEIAIKAAYEALAVLPTEHPRWVRLQQVLDEIRDELHTVHAGFLSSNDSFDWILRGTAIDLGRAPIEIVVEKIRQVDRLGVRIFEHLSRIPLRTRGAVAPEVRRGFKMTISQPAVGSFRFTTRFATQLSQLQLLSTEEAVSHPEVPPDQLTTSLTAILTASQDLDATAMDRTIEDPRYREAFLRLLRDMAPDGRDITTLEVRRRGGSHDSIVVLRAGLRQLITERLASSRVRNFREVERTGVLRAVDLNNGWIKLGRKGEATRWDVGGALVLEDVIEGLVNKMVRVVGHQQGNRRIIDDIQEAQSEASEADHADAPQGLEPGLQEPLR